MFWKPILWVLNDFLLYSLTLIYFVTIYITNIERDTLNFFYCNSFVSIFKAIFSDNIFHHLEKLLWHNERKSYIYYSLVAHHPGGGDKELLPEEVDNKCNSYNGPKRYIQIVGSVKVYQVHRPICPVGWSPSIQSNNSVLNRRRRRELVYTAVHWTG